MDSRVQGIIGLDPWVEPFSEKTLEKRMKCPYLFLQSEEWIGKKNDENLYNILSNNHQGELYQIMGTTHVDFTMIHLYSPITSTVRLTGSLDRDRFEDIQEAFVLDFFGRHLLENKKEKEHLSMEKYEEVFRVPRE
jgi:hypothetical protein